MADVRLKGVIGYSNNAEIASREGGLMDREPSSSESDQKCKEQILREILGIFAKF